MTVISMIISLILGIVLLIVGILTQKKWIKGTAILLLLLVLINILFMLGIGLH